MIRVYIIAADTPERISFAFNSRRAGKTARPIQSVQEVVEIRDLADPVRMRAIATEIHQHFKGASQ